LVGGWSLRREETRELATDKDWRVHKTLHKLSQNSPCMTDATR
jgi:hypothetical protein